MKRLFALKKQNGNLVAGEDKRILYFRDKPTAKVWRDEYNKVEYIKNPVVVTAGPDHHNYKGNHHE